MLFKTKFRKKKPSFLRPQRPRRVNHFKNYRIRSAIMHTQRLASFFSNALSYIQPKKSTNLRLPRALAKKVNSFVKSKRYRMRNSFPLTNNPYRLLKHLKKSFLFFSFRRNKISLGVYNPVNFSVYCKLFWYNLNSQSTLVPINTINFSSSMQVPAIHFFLFYRGNNRSLVNAVSSPSLIKTNWSPSLYFNELPPSRPNFKTRIGYRLETSMAQSASFRYVKSKVKFFLNLKRLITLHKKLKRRKFNFFAVYNMSQGYIDDSNLSRAFYLWYKTNTTSGVSSLKTGRRKIITHFTGPRKFRLGKIKALPALESLGFTKDIKLPRFKTPYKKKSTLRDKVRRSLKSVPTFFLKHRVKYFLKRLKKLRIKKFKKFRWKKRKFLRPFNSKRRRVYRTIKNFKRWLNKTFFKTRFGVSTRQVLSHNSKQFKKQVEIIPTWILESLQLKPNRVENYKFASYLQTPRRYKKLANSFYLKSNRVKGLSDLTNLALEPFFSNKRLGLMFRSHELTRFLIAQPLLLDLINRSTPVSTDWSLNRVISSWAVRLQNDLESSLFTLHGYSARESNLWAITEPDSFIKKKIIRANAAALFKPRIANWYYTTLVRFLENSLGRKIALTFGPFVDDVLSFEERSKCLLWTGRLRGFQRMLGKKIFLLESTRLILASFKLQDPVLLSNWIRAMLKRMSFWKYRLLFRYLDFLVRHVIRFYFPEIGVKGFKLQLKGKISVAGNARTRTLFKRVGTTSHAKMNNRVAYHLSLVNTFTGVMGLKVWIFY